MPHILGGCWLSVFDTYYYPQLWKFTCIKLAKTCILKGAVYWTEAVWLGNVYKTPTPIVGMDKKVRLDTLMCGKRLDFYLGHVDVCMP